MLKLTGISASPSQTFRTPIDQGIITFTLSFRPGIAMWFLNIEFGDKTINGLRVCRNANLLYQYQKTLPFGLFVGTDGGVEPNKIDDFSTGRFTLNVMNESDVEAVNQAYRDAKT
jgi:hypothetical protein